MPLRLGLLARFESPRVESFLGGLSGKAASDVMTCPAVSVREDQTVSEVVDLMLAKGLKRLPVVREDRTLLGMVCRSDIFKIAGDVGPVYAALEERRVDVQNIRFVRDIMQRDTLTVGPRAPLKEVVQAIDASVVQRVPVVDGAGRFLGLIFDLDVLGTFSDHVPGVWDFLVGRLSFTEMGRKHRAFTDRLQAKVAEDVMQCDIVVVQEDTPIGEAIWLMSERRLKRLPVVDDTGIFKGMVSRDAVLRAGVGGE